MERGSMALRYSRTRTISSYIIMLPILLCSDFLYSHELLRTEDAELRYDGRALFRDIMLTELI